MTRRRLRADERTLWARVTATVQARPDRHAAHHPDKDQNPQDDTHTDDRLQGPLTHRPDASPPRGRAKQNQSSRQTSAGAVGAPGPHAAARRDRVAPPSDLSGVKRVRRGRVEVAGRLDLHGMTQMQARGALLGFLVRAREEGASAVLVITGKGRPGRMSDMGEGGGVLRRRLPEWLADADMRVFVTGYAPAHRDHGGDGAWYVFIRRPDDHGAPFR